MNFSIPSANAFMVMQTDAFFMKHSFPLTSYPALQTCSLMLWILLTASGLFKEVFPAVFLVRCLTSNWLRRRWQLFSALTETESLYNEHVSGSIQYLFFSNPLSYEHYIHRGFTSKYCLECQEPGWWSNWDVPSVQKPHTIEENKSGTNPSYNYRVHIPP